MRQETVTLVDDLDGSPADETVEIALDGRAVQVDLSAVNAARLREQLAPFLAAGRRVASRRRGTATAQRTTERSDNAAIREWAQGQGYKIGERGRLPAEVKEAYHKAHA